MQYSYPLYVLRPWRLKTRLVLPLYEPVLQALHFDLDKPDELLICRLHPPYLTLRVAYPEKLLPLTEFDLKDLPPPWPQQRKAGTR